MLFLGGAIVGAIIFGVIGYTIGKRYGYRPPRPPRPRMYPPQPAGIRVLPPPAPVDWQRKQWA